MKTEQPILITSITAAVDLSSSKNLFIDFAGNIASLGEKPLGVLNADTALGEQAPVTCAGIALVYSSAALSPGNKVQSDANGKALLYAAGEAAGYSLDTAIGADELIRVLLI